MIAFIFTCSQCVTSFGELIDLQNHTRECRVEAPSSEEEEAEEEEDDDDELDPYDQYPVLTGRTNLTGLSNPIMFARTIFTREQLLAYPNDVDKRRPNLSKPSLISILRAKGGLMTKNSKSALVYDILARQHEFPEGVPPPGLLDLLGRPLPPLTDSSYPHFLSEALLHTKLVGLLQKLEDDPDYQLTDEEIMLLPKDPHDKLNRDRYRYALSVKSYAQLLRFVVPKEIHADKKLEYVQGIQRGEGHRRPFDWAVDADELFSQRGLPDCEYVLDGTTVTTTHTASKLRVTCSTHNQTTQMNTKAWRNRLDTWQDCCFAATVLRPAPDVTNIQYRTLRSAKRWATKARSIDAISGRLYASYAIGCSQEFLESWLRWQCIELGYSYEQYSVGWIIDHVYPRNQRHAPGAPTAIFHWTNLSLLSLRGNRIKGDRIVQGAIDAQADRVRRFEKSQQGTLAPIFYN